jgi:hypothetical protein
LVAVASNSIECGVFARIVLEDFLHGDWHLFGGFAFASDPAPKPHFGGGCGLVSVVATPRSVVVIVVVVVILGRRIEAFARCCDSL